MQTRIKQTIKKTFLFQLLWNWTVKRKREQEELIAWQKNQQHGPPPHIVKQQTIKAYAKRFGLHILVETGTYYGDMVEAMKGHFDQIYSIELSRELYETAQERFKRAKNVELICGDSANELENIMRRLDRPALFWLDGHYSAGVTAKGVKNTPIFEELTHIFNAPDQGHVILIDDARLFGTVPDYPSLQELAAFISAKKPHLDMTVEADSIRITSRK